MARKPLFIYLFFKENRNDFPISKQHRFSKHLNKKMIMVVYFQAQRAAGLHDATAAPIAGQGELLP